MSLNDATCSMGIFACIVFYCVSKLLTYLFLRMILLFSRSFLKLTFSQSKKYTSFGLAEAVECPQFLIAWDLVLFSASL